jgi:hypothetical protein
MAVTFCCGCSLRTGVRYIIPFLLCLTAIIQFVVGLSLYSVGEGNIGEDLDYDDRRRMNDQEESETDDGASIDFPTYEEWIVGAVIILVLQMITVFLCIVITLDWQTEYVRGKLGYFTSFLMMILVIVTIVLGIQEMIFLESFADSSWISPMLSLLVVEGTDIYFAFIVYTYAQRVSTGSIHSASNRVYVQ